MPKLKSCPSFAELQQFAKQALSQEMAEGLARHLEECEPCAELLDKYKADHSSTEDMRDQAVPTTEIPGLATRDLMSPPARALKSEAGDATTLSVPHGPKKDLAAAVVSLLGPPQYPDELGRLGGYRLIRVLGAGGMGIVFEAEDLQLMRRVALKAISPDLAGSESARQRFLREARSAAGIQHDHVIVIHQVGVERDIPYYAMPLLQGESLEACLACRGRLPVDWVVQIGAEIAEGLAAAHAQGVIHRDIKPANIFLETVRKADPAASSPPLADDRAPTSVRVKILDFGLARDFTDKTSLTRPGDILGTPGFLAPEQARGTVIDHRCDLFSLGCVLYLMCTGKQPFVGKNTTDRLIALADHDPPAPDVIDTKLPRALSAMVMWLMAKDPNKRPQTARTTAAALRNLAAAPIGSGCLI